MKNLILLFSVLQLIFISCNSNNSKQVLSSSEDTPDSLIVENNRINDSVESGHPEKSTTLVSDKTGTQTIMQDNDTTIYEIPATTAVLENAIEYFRANNKYKNWRQNDKRFVILKCITEKDASISNIGVLRGGSGNSDLDNEAIRLIKQAKLIPAKNEKNEVIRSFWMTVIHFPPE